MLHCEVNSCSQTCHTYTHTQFRQTCGCESPNPELPASHRAAARLSPTGALIGVSSLHYKPGGWVGRIQTHFMPFYCLFWRNINQLENQMGLSCCAHVMLLFNAAVLLAYFCGFLHRLRVPIIGCHLQFSQAVFVNFWISSELLCSAMDQWKLGSDGLVSSILGPAGIYD